MSLTPPGKSFRDLAGLVFSFALVLTSFSLGNATSVAAQTPPTSPAPAASTPGSDVLSFVSDTLPERKRDLYVMHLDGTDKKQITSGFNVWFASWAPDGKHIAVTTEQGLLYTVSPDGSNLKLLTPGAFSPPFWSPDGHFIAYVGGEHFGAPVARGDLRIIPSTGGTPWLVPHGEDIPSLPPGASAVAWSGDGTKIAAGWPGRILYIANGPGQPVDVEPLKGGRDWFVIAGGWAPDNKHLAVTDGIDYGILDMTTGDFVSVGKSFKQPGLARAGVSWSAGIKKVAFAINSAASDGQRLFLADFDGHNAKVILSAPHKAVYHDDVSDYGPPFFSADSKTMLLRVSRTTAEANGTLLYTHESWLVNTDGSGGHKLVDGFNANWQPKVRLPLPDSAFWWLWRSSDLPVANGQAQHAYLWGPTAIFSGTEPYAQAAGGQQQVVYFDKGRMEIKDPNLAQPSKYLVTAGALARELVTGQIVVGDTQTQAKQSPGIALAGDDPNADVPTYATFNKLGAGTDAGKAQDKTGQPVDGVLARDGTVRIDHDLGQLAKVAAFLPETGHNLPDVFLNYFNAQLPNWIYVAGYPISEAYWAHATVGGQPHPVLVQVFERRTITYDPAAPDAFKVQFGNVGRHYYDWRYGK